MSVVSGRSSMVSIVRDSLQRRSTLVKFKSNIFPKKVESALGDLLQKKNPKAYEELVCTLRDCTLSDDDLMLVLTECYSCLGWLGRETRLLVEALCSSDWPSREATIVHLFSNWLVDLLAAHIFHTPMVIGSLVKLLGKNDCLWSDMPTEQQTVMFSNIHKLIARVVANIPMSSEVLLKCTIESFPYYKHSVVTNQAYIHNLLWITRYLPALTDHLLTLILNRLIIMDVNIRSSSDLTENYDETELFAMDDAGNESEQLIECLDLCMLELIKWLQQEGPRALDILFSVFELTLLPTHGTKYVQFIVLYGLSLDFNRITQLLEMLWQLVASARVGPGLRQASVAHLAGLLTRANFIPMQLINLYIKKMADWCHAYIKAQDSLHSQSGNNPHGVFYFVCQSLFYLIAFKHSQIFSAKKGLIFLESLNLSKIVMCPLNPLRMCQTSVAEAFASITRIHQVVYCHTVMEHNIRHYLKVDDDIMKEQEWFPYDPYTLPKSYRWIKPLYGEYQDTIKDKTLSKFTEGGCDEDDFLSTSPNMELSNSMSKCSLTSFRHL